MLRNNQHDGSSMEKVIIIEGIDPYVLLNHLKGPISKLIEGDEEDGEPVVIYNKKHRETFVFNYLYVSDNKSSGLKTLSMMIDPLSTLLFPRARNLNMLKTAIKSKKLLEGRLDLNPLRLIDEFSDRLDNPLEVMFTFSNPIYSISRVWREEQIMSSEQVFDQIIDFLRLIFTYYKKGLNMAIDIFNAFCMDVLVHHRQSLSSISGEIVMLSKGISHPTVKSIDIIVPGKRSLYPVIVINYASSHSEAFIPISVNSKESLPFPDLQIWDMSILFTRLFHHKVVHLVSMEIVKALELFSSGRANDVTLLNIKNEEFEQGLQNLLAERYGIRKM
ncbi:MAG: hypothetical protein GXO48_05545 [Chlorobi bacterium]|nr:hypothetical protein [Chlorobiota bacterium]